LASILIIDDEDKYLELCRRHMPEHSFLEPARNHREAEVVLSRAAHKIDLILLDVHFDIPDEDLLPEDKAALLAKGKPARVMERLRRSQGLRILDRLRGAHPAARDDLPLEADAERLNAQDYTYFVDDEYLDARSLKVQVEGILARRERPQDDGPFFWGSTPSMHKLRRRVQILARGQLPIIIQGPTGTGKSLLAREHIHRNSGRSGPFVAVDLSTIPTDLMGAHLFGVVKGAYTGATHTREGVLGRAHGGTLFLDEIGNLSFELQKSLLLVLQEGAYRPVGSVEERVADIKLVVATNQNLARMVREGKFREDLLMRLNPATAITLPTLRERSDDFAQLLQFFVRRVCDESYNRDLLLQYLGQRGLPVPADGEPVQVTVDRKLPPELDTSRVHLLLHPSSFNLLRDYDWPGNFRQFEMLLSNLVTFTLVDLVEKADLIEPEEAAGSRLDVIPIQPRTVRDLLRPWDEVAKQGGEGEDGDGLRCEIDIETESTLNKVSQNVERQYLEHLYKLVGGDLGAMAERLLGDADAGRKVQMRMNQLGIKLRELKRGRPA
jgi:DNA-binding NtrC family response regulator